MRKAINGVKDGVGLRLLFLYMLPIFAISAQFRFRDYGDKSIDFQTIIRLLAFSCLFLLPLIYRKVWIALAKSRSELLLIILFAFLLCTSPIAPNPGFSAFNAFSMIIGYVYAIMLIEVVGQKGTVKLLVLLGGSICVISLIVLLVNPEFAKMQAWDGFEIADVNRLKGITGSANGMGSIASLTILFTVLFYKDFDRNWRKIGIYAVIASLFCLYLSNNRMSMLATVIALWYYYAIVRGKAAGVVGSLISFSVAAVVLSLFSNEIFSALSRSGDASEITSGTGRAEIWNVVLELWAASPFIGYGYSSASAILPLDPRLFSVAAHAHNMYLEILFSGGMIGFILLILFLVSTISVAVRNKQWKFLAILIFFIVRGLTEATPFSGVASYNSMILFILVAGIYRPSIERLNARALHRSYRAEAARQDFAAGAVQEDEKALAR